MADKKSKVNKSKNYRWFKRVALNSLHPNLKEKLKTHYKLGHTRLPKIDRGNYKPKLEGLTGRVTHLANFKHRLLTKLSYPNPTSIPIILKNAKTTKAQIKITKKLQRLENDCCNPKPLTPGTQLKTHFTPSQLKASMQWKLIKVQHPQHPQGREPRRNMRDPRLRSYRGPNLPLPLVTSPPRQIPGHYDPAADAKPPVRTLGLERSSFPKVIMHIFARFFFPINLIYLMQTSPPNINGLMEEMERVHAPTPVSYTHLTLPTTPYV